MYATNLTQQSARRWCKLAAMVGAALTLFLAVAHVDTAAASTSFPDNITVAAEAKCVSYGSTQYTFSVMASPTNYSYSYPYPTTSYVTFRLVNTSTNTKVWEKGWVPFSSYSGITYWIFGNNTLGTPGTGRFIMQAVYGRYVGTVWYQSTNWETIGVLNYPWGNICF